MPARSLGLDVGARRIGLALAHDGLALAHGKLERAGAAKDRNALLELVDLEGVQEVVVGLPLELDGREGHRARRVRLLARELEAALMERGVGLHFWDERFSTAGAERGLREVGMGAKRQKEHVDAAAAQFLLQGWLDAQGEKGSGS